jgi:GNAT superfamily N-acetyltransferase
MTVVGGTPTPTLSYRPARPEELAACAEVWRHGINDYIRKLNQPDVPDEVAPLIRLYTHLQATDPERFVVGTVPADADAGASDGAEAAGGERVVAFAAAAQRERLWFLSMCFVLPGFQGAGVGRALLARVLPADAAAGADVVRATATDSAQPISNALYAMYGIVPRVPLLNLIGEAGRAEVFGTLPSGVLPVPFETLASDGGHDRLAATIDTLDRELLGVAHPLDHRFLRQEGRRGWLYQGPDGAPLGYGYASEAGRIGPVAVRDGALLGPVVGHLATAVVPRGAFAIWLPGTADRAVVPALQAGFRLEAFPLLLCWDRPFADLSRYLPISPGLL